MKPTATPAPPLLIGRERHLAELETAFDEARAGSARFVVVTGEAGVGKTALVEELSRRAAGRDAFVAWARSAEVGGAPPFWPWTQVLEQLLERRGIGDALDDPTRRVIAPLVPRLLASTARSTDLDSDQARFAMFDGVARLLRRAAEAQPVLVVLDDLHAADASSLELLAFAVDHLRAARCLLLATARKHGKRFPRNTPLLVQTVARATEMPLRGLTREELVIQIEAAAGRRPTDRDVDVLYRTTAGNPLFTKELLRLFGRLPATGIGGPTSLPLPDSIRELVTRRIEALPDPTLRILRLLAVAGLEFDLALAATVAGDEAETAIELGLEEGLLEPTEVPGRHRFTHGLIQATLYASQPPTTRRQTHAAVGTLLERQREQGEDIPLAVLAHHFAQSDDPRSLGKAFSYAAGAGAEARRALSYEGAAFHYREALHLASRLEVDERERAELLLALGEAQMRAGAAADGRSTLLQAWDLARPLEEATLLGRIAAGLGMLPPEGGGIIDEVLVDRTQQAIDSLGRPSGLRARLQARLCAEMLLRHDQTELEQMARRSVAEARSAGNQQDLMATLRWTQTVLSTPRNVDEALRHATDAVELARRTGDVYLQAETLAYRTIHDLALGRVTDLDIDVAALGRIRDAFATPLHRWYVAANDARRALMRGGRDRGLRLAGAALEHLPDAPFALRAWRMQSFLHRWEVGGIESFEEVLHALVDQRPGSRPMCYSALTLLLAETGRSEEARTRLQPLVEEHLGRSMPWVWLVDVGWLADAACRLGAADEARRLASALQPFADLHVVGAVRTAVIYWGSVRRHLANLAFTSGDLETAVGEGEAALRAHVHVGAAAYVARSQLELARALLARGRAADAHRAERLLEEAAVAADRLGLAPLQEDIRTAAPRIAPIAPAASVADEGPSAVLEGEYWTLSHGGGVTRLRRGKGLDYLVTLLERPDEGVHVLELCGVSPRGSAGTPTDALSSDRGAPILDGRATRAYRARIRELQEELEDAEASNDIERAGRARIEMDRLIEELEQALMPSGRSRRLGSSAAEQARVSVTKAIRRVLRKVAEVDPVLAAHLRSTIQTGYFCSYSSRLGPTFDWRIRRR